MRPLIVRHQNNFTPNRSRIYIIVFPLRCSFSLPFPLSPFLYFSSACTYCLLEEPVNCTMCVWTEKEWWGRYLAVHAVLNEPDWQGGIYWWAPLKQRVVALSIVIHTHNSKCFIWDHVALYFLFFLVNSNIRRGHSFTQKLDSVITYPHSKPVWLPFFCRTQKKIFWRMFQLFLSIKWKLGSKITLH